MRYLSFGVDAPSLTVQPMASVGCKLIADGIWPADGAPEFPFQ